MTVSANDGLSVFGELSLGTIAVADVKAATPEEWVKALQNPNMPSAKQVYRVQLSYVVNIS